MIYCKWYKWWYDTNTIFVGEQANLIFIRIHQVTISIMKFLFYSSKHVKLLYKRAKLVYVNFQNQNNSVTFYIEIMAEDVST